MISFQFKEEVDIPLKDIVLTGDLAIPDGTDSIVIFAHGSGSSRYSPRNKFIAEVLQQTGFATLLFDLLTLSEDQEYSTRFNIDLLSKRLVDVTRWLTSRPDFDLNIGYFGASTGAAATLVAAAQLGDLIKAVVSRGGRPDLAMKSLPLVKAPTLLIVGSLDSQVIALNEKALARLGVDKEMVLIEGATHLFEEAGKLEEVAGYSSKWFTRYLKRVHA